MSQFKQDYEGFKGTVYTKSQTDTKVSTVQQSVDNFKTTVSNTYSSKAETDSKVTAVQANVDKLGTNAAYANSADGTDGFTTVYPNLNLLDGTKDFSGDWWSHDGWETDGKYKGLTVKKRIWQWQGICKPFTAQKDGVYTFSAYVKGSGSAATIYRFVNCWDINGNEKWIMSNPNLFMGNSFDWLRDSFTVNLKTGDTPNPRYEISGAGTDSIVWTAGHKWEEGSVATPYMPSEKELTSNDIPKYVGYSVRQSENPKDFSWQPYDGLNSYKIIEATTAIEQNSKDIALKANKTEVNTLSGRVSTAEGAITTMAGQIKLKANQTDVDTVKGRVTSAEGSISLISGKVALKANKTEVDTLSGKVSTAESSLKIQDGQIKALNTKTDGHTTQIGTLESSYNGFKSTISKIQTDVGGKAGKTELSQLSQDLSGFKNTVSSTYLSKSNASGTYADKVSVASQITQSATAVTSNVQSWTNNKLTAYSTTQQTASSITNAVASKADKSQITQLSDQITSTVTSLTNETLITTQMIQSARLKHPNYPDMPMVEVPVTNGESYTVTTNQPWEGTATAPIAHVWFLRLPSTTPNSAINGIFDGKSVTLPALSDKIYIVFRTQSIADRFISGKYWVKVTKTPASQSQITQLASDINLRVSKGDVTSQINIEAGRLLIDTKQLLLNANTVKFSGSAFIPNAMIQTIAADKITAGTINAANVNIINLNAANITTGTLSGANLSMNLNTGAVQFRKGYIEGNNGRIRLDLDNSYLKSFNASNKGFEIQDGVLKLYSNVLNSSSVATIETDILAKDGGVNISAIGGVSLVSTKYKASIGVGTGGLANGNEISLQGNAFFWNGISVMGKKNAVHVTRDGVRATPAYETAESYLGDIGRNYTREDYEIWVHIDELFSDTVNTDIAYEVFLQAYDDARFWVSDFKSDKFLVKSDKPMARFAWEIKAKRRGYENDRLVIQEGFDNKMLDKVHDEGAFKGDSENE